MKKYMGLKAQAKQFLRSKGIKEVKTDTGVRKLDNAKTIYLVKEATVLGWQIVYGAVERQPFFVIIKL